MVEKTGLIKRVERLNERLAARPVHVKITGWGGVRNIPVKAIRAFVKDLKVISSIQGFSVRDQTVQLQQPAISKLGEIVKNHGLQMGAPKKATHAIIGFD